MLVDLLPFRAKMGKARVELTVCFLALGLIVTGMAAKFIPPPCDRHMFDSGVDDCLSAFNSSMEASGYQDGCAWPTVSRTYYQLKFCVDHWAVKSWCKGSGSLVDEVFLAVHQTYFSPCAVVRDPPLVTLILLISPSIVITLIMPFLCLPLTTKVHGTCLKFQESDKLN